MINIAIAQIPNTTDVERNFSTIMSCLHKLENTSAHLVLFPECSLSGFSAAIKECHRTSLEKYFIAISTWSEQSGIDVVLPTALVEEKIYNTGFVFSHGTQRQFYKLGLTESEQKFFSTPMQAGHKVFECQGYRYGLLICLEAQLEPWKYFSQGECDFILWPGYWGWSVEDQWEAKKQDGETNLIYQNMQQWKLPLLQSNFSHNDFGDTRTGPQGLSVAVDSDNRLVKQGAHDTNDLYMVTLAPSDSTEHPTKLSLVTVANIP